MFSIEKSCIFAAWFKTHENDNDNENRLKMNDKLTDWEKAVARVIWPGIGTNDDDWTPEGRELLRKQSKKMLDLCRQPLIDKAVAWLKANVVGWDMGKWPEYAPDFLDKFQQAMKED